MSKDYQPKTPATILLSDLMAFAKREKIRFLAPIVAFMDTMLDLEELDNSPTFQGLAESIRARWNLLAASKGETIPPLQAPPAPPLPPSPELTPDGLLAPQPSALTRLWRKLWRR